jgi:hypothetical protein
MKRTSGGTERSRAADLDGIGRGCDGRAAATDRSEGAWR